MFCLLVAVICIAVDGSLRHHVVVGSRFVKVLLRDIVIVLRLGNVPLFLVIQLCILVYHVLVRFVLQGMAHAILRLRLWC